MKTKATAPICPKDLEDRVRLLERRQQRASRTVARAMAPYLLAVALMVPAVGFASGNVPHVFEPSTPARAAEVNANFKYLADRVVPAGTVIFYDGDACPEGWSVFTEARGRTMVGVPTGGTLKGIVGEPLADRTPPAHSHDLGARATAVAAGGHNHLVMRFDEYKNWDTFTESGALANNFMNWGDGIDGDGVGIYPFATQSNSPVSVYTQKVANHSHTLAGSSESTSTSIPYVQLLACKKS